MNKKLLKYSITVGFIVSMIFASWLYLSIFVSNVPNNGVLYINSNDTRDSVLVKLKNQELVKDISSLIWVMNKKNYSHIKTGKYLIKKGSSNNDLVNKLRSGNQDAVHLTFNNVRTKEDFAGKVSHMLMLDSLKILNKLKDDSYTQSIGFNSNTIIGMFLPNTYEMYWDISINAFFNKMHREYNSFWTLERRNKAKSAHISPMGAIIIASIIEEETVQAREYPIIAGVYINRLHRGIPLMACPTLKFALGNFELKRILNIHKEVKSPYNTYKHRGLPPGPIRQPSINVIDQVLNYQKHKYLYFCAKEDFSGFHNFSKTLHQHNLYAEKYRRELNKRRIYK